MYAKVRNVKRLNQADIAEMLRKLQGDMTQKELAEKIGVSQQYLCDVLIGRRDPGPMILTYLGIEKAYVQTSSSKAADEPKKEAV